MYKSVLVTRPYSFRVEWPDDKIPLGCGSTISNFSEVFDKFESPDPRLVSDGDEGGRKCRSRCSKTASMVDPVDSLSL